MIRKSNFLIILFIAVSFGCAHEEAQIKPAEELFKEATDLASEENVEKASEKFMEVRTYYPGHELAKKSLLATADLYYNQKDYSNALSSYEEFRLLYPTDIEASYSLFKIGMCHFNQISTYDRDQSDTVKTIQTLENFLSSYPESPYLNDASSHLKDARTMLATYYIYIGKFYLKKDKPDAACKRFEHVKKNYSDLSLPEDLDDLISRSCKKESQ